MGIKKLRGDFPRQSFLVAVLMSHLLVASAVAQSTVMKTNSPAAPTANAAQSAKVSSKPAPIHYRPERFPKRAKAFYDAKWGIDSLAVKTVESGAMVKVSYRVLDPEKAKILIDKKLDPFLVDPRAGVKLVVPQMEKIGMLRQTTALQPGKVYWVLFSNKGGYLKKGDRVSLVIGTFHADGLVVD